MANPEHVERLREGNIHTWNKWRAKHPQIKLDFSGENFRSEYLGELNFRNANFRNAMLIDVNFIDAKLIGADFSNAKLEEAYFFNTDLTDAILHNAGLEFSHIGSGTNLLCADLTNAKMYYTKIHQAILAGANFTKVEMGSTVIADVDLSEVKGLNSVSWVSSAYQTVTSVSIPVSLSASRRASSSATSSQS